MPERAERAAMGLREQHPGEALVVDEGTDEGLEPGPGGAPGPWGRKGSTRAVMTAMEWSTTALSRSAMVAKLS